MSIAHVRFSIFLEYVLQRFTLVSTTVFIFCQDLLREPLIADKRYKKEALECFKLIQVYMGDRKAPQNNRAINEEDLQINCALDLATRGWENVHLRDELLLQVCKQSIDNSKQ